MVPEETDLGAVLSRGSELHVIRFDRGMASGETAIGVGIQEIVDHNVVTRVVQVSLASLRTMMAALEAAEDHGHEAGT
jgi:hypothetical protein